MKKFVEFLKKPYTTTLLCVVGLTGGFVIGKSLSIAYIWQNNELDKTKSCKQAYKTMCVQVHACTGSSVEDCDALVVSEDLCKVRLPDIQIIYNCEEELRHIECTDNMPKSCTLFME